MTIETGPTQNASRSAATESKSAKTKTADSSASPAAGPGGFMAILASLDTSESAAADLVLPGDDTGAIALSALKRATGLHDSAGDVDLATTEADLHYFFTFTAERCSYNLRLEGME